MRRRVCSWRTCWRTPADETPGTPVLLMSGACPSLHEAPAPCLPKPFAADRFLALVGDLLVA